MPLSVVFTTLVLLSPSLQASFSTGTYVTFRLLSYSLLVQCQLKSPRKLPTSVIQTLFLLFTGQYTLIVTLSFRRQDRGKNTNVKQQ